MKAFDLEALEFGKDYLVPKPLDTRVCLWEAPAVADAAIQSGVARLNNSMDVYRIKLAQRLQCDPGINMLK